MMACSTGKVRYRDEIGAKIALASIGTGRHERRPKSEQRAYRCPWCRGWHLTAQPQRKATP
jgi:hypothetical protein